MGAGFTAFVDGYRAVMSPGVKRYLFVPALISTVIIGGGLFAAYGYVQDAANWVADFLPSWLDWLQVIVAPILYTLGFLASVWLFGFVAVVVSGPFMGPLSVRIETLETGSAVSDESSLAATIGHTIKREAQKLWYILPRLLGLLLLSLIPVLNLIAPAAWLLFGAWSMAIQFGDYPAENRKQPLQSTFALLRNNRAAALGFGACVTVTMSIPLVNFVVVPIAVAGGTLLWHRLQNLELSS
jgi:CysZ protein